MFFPLKLLVKSFAIVVNMAWSESENKHDTSQSNEAKHRDESDGARQDPPLHGDGKYTEFDGSAKAAAPTALAIEKSPKATAHAGQRSSSPQIRPPGDPTKPQKQKTAHDKRSSRAHDVKQAPGKAKYDSPAKESGLASLVVRKSPEQIAFVRPGATSPQMRPPVDPTNGKKKRKPPRGKRAAPGRDPNQSLEKANYDMPAKTPTSMSLTVQNSAKTTTQIRPPTNPTKSGERQRPAGDKRNDPATDIIQAFESSKPEAPEVEKLEPDGNQSLEKTKYDMPTKTFASLSLTVKQSTNTTMHVRPPVDLTKPVQKEKTARDKRDAPATGIVQAFEKSNVESPSKTPALMALATKKSPVKENPGEVIVFSGNDTAEGAQPPLGTPNRDRCGHESNKTEKDSSKRGDNGDKQKTHEERTKKDARDEHKGATGEGRPEQSVQHTQKGKKKGIEKNGDAERKHTEGKNAERTPDHNGHHKEDETKKDSGKPDRGSRNVGKDNGLSEGNGDDSKQGGNGGNHTKLAEQKENTHSDREEAREQHEHEHKHEQTDHDKPRNEGQANSGASSEKHGDHGDQSSDEHKHEHGKSDDHHGHGDHEASENKGHGKEGEKKKKDGCCARFKRKMKSCCGWLKKEEKIVAKDGKEAVKFVAKERVILGEVVEATAKEAAESKNPCIHQIGGKTLEKEKKVESFLAEGAKMAQEAKREEEKAQGAELKKKVKSLIAKEQKLVQMAKNDEKEAHSAEAQQKGTEAKSFVAKGQAMVQEAKNDVKKAQSVESTAEIQ